jgi:hypothetical protein
MQDYQSILALIAVAIGIAGYAVYIRSILKGQTKPHFYTHLIWAIISSIAFAAQLHDHGGPGAWVMGLTAAACLSQALLALRYGEKNITRGDKIALFVSLSAILPWVLTKNPIGSVILICLIDVVAFYPTFRKSIRKPWEENLTSYNFANLKMFLSILALTNMTWVTVLYPAVVIGVNMTFVLMCLILRAKMKAAIITP